MKEKLLSKNTAHWLLGLVISSLGLGLCTKSNLGLSMIGAASYILHVALRDGWSWFTQGTGEYVWEAIVLLVTCVLVRRFRWKYLLSFATAVLSGFIIDGWLAVLGGNGAYANRTVRIVAFIAGMMSTSLGIAFIFRTTLPPQVYELSVSEIADRFGFSKDKTKFGFDLTMLCASLAMSFLLTDTLTGIGVGTVVITFCNAPLIAFFGRIIDRIERKDA